MQAILYTNKNKRALGILNDSLTDRQVIPIPLKDGREIIPYDILDGIQNNIKDMYYWGVYADYLGNMTVITISESDLDNIEDPNDLVGGMPIPDGYYTGSVPS